MPQPKVIPMRLALFALALFWAPALSAGAWLQESKKGFLSFSVTYDETHTALGSAFLEYGINPKLTIGAKLDTTYDYALGLITQSAGYAFARLPIRTGDHSFKLAYEIGVGATVTTKPEPFLRTGLSYGRGYSLNTLNGWLALDLASEWSIEGQPDTHKFDATVGLALTDKFKVMMQVFVSKSDNLNTITLAPSLIWQPKPASPNIVFGIEDKGDILALKFGYWQRF